MEGCEDVEEDGEEGVEGTETEKEEDRSSVTAETPSEDVPEKITEEKEKSDPG